MSHQVTLSESQNASFDSEYHSPLELGAKFAVIRKKFKDRPLGVLDVGGGNGIFSDAFLEEFNNSSSLVIDISEHLLGLNKPHPRKTLLRSSIFDLPGHSTDKKYDIIFLNWILHHLVGVDYRNSLRNIEESLRIMKDRLAPGGLICVGENDYTGYFGMDFPSRMIFEITAVRSPYISKIVRRHANTAGTGVCFLSEASWAEKFRQIGLQIEYPTFMGPEFNLQRWKKRGLLISKARKIHFYLGCPD